MVEEMRAVREALDAMPERPWDREPPQPTLPAREERLAQARERRTQRLSRPEGAQEPTFRWVNGVELVYGPAEILQAAWVSGQPLQVGSKIDITLERVSAPDATGRCIGWPTGTAGKQGQRKVLPRTAARSAQPMRATRSHAGSRRASRERR